MNNHTLSLSRAIEGFQLDLAARHLSPHTVADYTNSLRRLQTFFSHPERSTAESKDPMVATITADDLRRFMADLEILRAPAGVARRPAQALSKKQCLNIHTGLSAFWTWLVRQHYADQHLLRLIARPKPEKRAIEPLTKDEIDALLRACERSRSYRRPGKRESDHTRPTGPRDRAIILLLLDTGLRASELCDLQIRHFDSKNKRILAFGKGDKERSLPVGPATAKALWTYIVAERREARVNEPLFIGRGDVPLTRSGLLQLLRALGKKAGIPDCHPHRFRHTFAINYLRNGGDAYALQMSLGHESMEMVRRYLSLASADLAVVHQRASPVEKWRL
jgi:integrase/recombinase XerD